MSSSNQGCTIAALSLNHQHSAVTHGEVQAQRCGVRFTQQFVVVQRLHSDLATHAPTTHNI